MNNRPMQLIAITFSGSLIVLVGLSAFANAASTPYLKLLNKNEDSFYNYDFLSQSPSSGNVDWPLTMIHCNNANVNKVKNIYFGLTVFANPMYFRMNNGAGYVWDSDWGTKSGVWYSPYIQQYVFLHQRVYAPNPPDYASNTSWGKYTLSTTHYDSWPVETWFGYSEYAELDFGTIAAGKQYTVLWNNVFVQNTDSRGWIGDHYWQSNGYATRICVP